MSFLSKKKRIIDTHLTPYGRKKIANGNIGIKFVAFTDAAALYSEDKSKKTRSEDFIEICNESMSNYQDQMFFDSNNIINLLDGKVQENISYQTENITIDGNGTLFNTETSTLNKIPEESFLSTANEIIDDSLKRIKNKKYLKNKANNDFDSFKIDEQEINFYITKNSPINSNQVKEIDIESTEPFFFDKYLSSTDHFKFLPPVIPSGENQNLKKQLGNYEDLNQEDIITYEGIENIIKKYPFEEINFVENSVSSNLIFQIFGIKNKNNESKITKLDTIDFGEFYQNGTFKKVIFAGKVFIDNTYNYPTYANIFTIVMEE